MASVHLFLYQKTLLFLSFFWFSLWGFLSRFRRNGGSLKDNSEQSKVVFGEINQEDSTLIETNPELEEKQDFEGFPNLESDGVGEEEDTQFSFNFKFPTYEEFSRSKKDFAHLLDFEDVQIPSATANRYEVFSGKSFSRFIDEPEALSFEINEVSNDGRVLLDEDFKQVHVEEEVSFGNNEVNTDSNGGFLLDKGLNQDHVEEEKETDEIGTSMGEKVQAVDAVQFCSQKGLSFVGPEPENGGVLLDENLNQVHVEKETVHEETTENSRKEICGENGSEEIGKSMEEKIQVVDAESNPESIGSSNFQSVMSHFVDTYGDGFLSDEDFGEEEVDFGNPTKFLSEKDFVEEVRKTSEDGEIGGKNENSKLESLWEHQELIEQLKMELKKVRATGLPTIMEESESPKMMEDLKPWKIEELYQRGERDRMGELHKFYKTYRERMRKFDIFNYQKMYAIGFLQLKDPLQSISITKSSIPEITSLFSQSFSTSKGKKRENEPMLKFIKELQSDLEVVYVGQMCLSWEILHWQYEKALDLWESDPRGVRRYNEVAGEFQQFQVLIQRFIEDEPFQGPRVQNYVKSRCILRNLLQVPVIRADSTKNISKARRSEEGAYDIRSGMLVEILEESIRLFWRFVRADKDRRPSPVPVEFQESADSQLFMEVQKDLQKKERKLKDQLRSGNCILRRFKKCREEDESEEQVLYFFSQVDMRLVSRVLHTSRITTDQLIWCRNKLSKVSFVNRRIHVEPTFLLFPC